MSIVANDLIMYGSVNRPEDASSTVGGAIDATNRPVFTQFVGTAKLALISDGADTRLVDIEGRDATGSKVTEQVTMNGAVEVLSANTYERILYARATTTSGTRTITLKEGSGGTTIGTIPVNEKGVFAMFIDAASGSGATIWYEKTFWKNTHATLTLTQAKARLATDAIGKLTQGIELTVNDTHTSTNRNTAPGNGVVFVGLNVDQDLPSSALAASSTVGIWWKLSLDANDSPIKNTFTARLAGATV